MAYTRFINDRSDNGQCSAPVLEITTPRETATSRITSRAKLRISSTQVMQATSLDEEIIKMFGKEKGVEMSVIWKQSYNNSGNLHARRIERGERRRDSSGIDEQMAVMVLLLVLQI